MTEPTSYHAELDWIEGGQPFSIRYADVYFSRDAGLDETRHVFLQHNQVAQRFGSLPAESRFCIGETGFGTGLNFLAAWQQERTPAFCQHRKIPANTDGYASSLEHLA